MAYVHPYANVKDAKTKLTLKLANKPWNHSKPIRKDKGSIALAKR